MLDITLVQFLILALATWRLASLFANEKGPMQIFERFRLWVGVYWDGSGKTARTNFGRGLICVWCSSVWIAFVLAILFALAPGQLILILSGLALSTVCVLIEEALNALME